MVRRWCMEGIRMAGRRAGKDLGGKGGIGQARVGVGRATFGPPLRMVLGDTTQSFNHDAARHAATSSEERGNRV